MQHIKSIISLAITSLYNVDFSPEISVAPKPELGEYCINVFPLAKISGKSPNLIAEEVASELEKHTDIFTSTNALGGYVNFFLTDRVWGELFSVIAKNEAIHAPKKIQKTIIVDYIGANVGKPLHIGHICTPSIGQVVCNTYRHLGYTVIGDSHFGDWGGIFGKLIYGWEKYAEIEGEEQNLIRLNHSGVDYLLDIYQWIHNQTKDSSISEVTKMQTEEIEKSCRTEFQYLSGVGIDLSSPDELKHHEENVELWKRFTSISIAETEKKLALLNVKATFNIGESFYEGLSLPRPNDEKYPNLQYNMKDIVKELIEKGIATQNDDGSVGVIFPDDTKIPSCVLQKKDGTGLYLTSDLAAIKYRLTNGWNPSKILYSVDVRQQLHLKQAFWIAKQAWGMENIELTHISNGFIKLKEGAMSTRHGTVIFLEALIDEGKMRTQKILEEKGRTGEKGLSPENIEAITIGAIKYSYLMQDREKDIVFDWDKALSFEGHSGPYIQYAYVRAKKISESDDRRYPFQEGQDVSTSAIASSRHDRNFGSGTANFELSSHDKSLIQILSRFEEVIENTAKTYKPHHIALYAYDLAVSFNSFYVHTPKILEENDEDLKSFRLTLVEKTTNTLKKAFELLAIEMPSEM